jgi:hypothetical protein
VSLSISYQSNIVLANTIRIHILCAGQPPISQPSFNAAHSAGDLGSFFPPLSPFFSLFFFSYVWRSTDKDAVHVTSTGESIKGTMSITNYRFAFQDEQGDFIADFPLGNIHKIEKVGGMTSSGDNAYVQHPPPLTVFAS